MKMQYLKVAVDPDLKKKLKLLTAETGTTLSHLVSEILWQYVSMPEVKIPQVRIPERMAKAEADKVLNRALKADNAERDRLPQTRR